ncbi:hypothetical protein FKM82_000798 [Ascaphus truei]
MGIPAIWARYRRRPAGGTREEERRFPIESQWSNVFQWGFLDSDLQERVGSHPNRRPQKQKLCLEKSFDQSPVKFRFNWRGKLRF